MIRVCSRCDHQNPVTAEQLANAGRCRACHEPLRPAYLPIDVGVEDFDEIVGGAHVPVLVDFWAPWCSPCRLAAPVIKRIASEFAGSAIVLRVNADRYPGLAQRLAIRGIPTFAVFYDGVKLLQQAGLVEASQLKLWLQSACEQKVPA